jgi:hypothetical protein
MAARINRAHDEKTRAKIQTSQLINRLQDNAFGKVDLSAGQLKSIEILLKKTLPDLSAMSVEGPNGQDLFAGLDVRIRR